MSLDELERERAAREKRRWVRLTRCCNNHCLFCLDSEVQDGTVVGADMVRREMEEGIGAGAFRLILSGGEPTLHPKFLDFLALGRELGYGWRQVITNGRMFAYRRFAERAVAAGLDEATFSMHGHRAELHDRLVAVEGAFRQSLQGMRQLMQAGAVVNVDIVINRLNLEHLPAVMDFFLREGIREFDLLWPVPFGRAWQNRQLLLLPKAEPAPPLMEAIRMARQQGANVWTNRLPPALLEGAEELIQDPYKIHDEVRGRQEELDRWLAGREPLPCRQTERCAYCFLENFCADIEKGLARREAPSPAAPVRPQADSPDKIARVLEGEGEVEIVLNRRTAAWIKENAARIRAQPQRFFFSLPGFLSLAELQSDGVDPVEALAPLHGAPVRLVEIPPCVLPDAESVSPRDWPARPWRPPPALEEMVDDFIRQRYRLHSLRCTGCAWRNDCVGFPVNYLRLYGFSLARPLGGEDGERFCAVAMGSDGLASMVIRTKCSNCCSFCTTALIARHNRAPWRVDDPAVILRTLDQLREKGYRRLRLAAIEPLEHPRILEVLQAARARGFEQFEIWSHAGPCADADFSRRLLEAGLKLLDVPLFGPDADLHDAIAGRRGAFDQTRRGLGQLRALGFENIKSHLVVTRGNHRAVVKTFLFAERSEFGPLSSLVLAAPSLPGAEHYRPVAFRLSELVEAVAAEPALLGGEQRRRLLVLLSRSLPHCLLLGRLPECRPYLTEGSAPLAPAPQLQMRRYDQSLDEEGRPTVGGDLKQRTRCPEHRRCALAEYCPGIYPYYLDLFGQEEFTPWVE